MDIDLKTQRNKEKNQNIRNIIPKSSRRKNIRKTNEILQEDLKHRIVKLFMNLGKEQINEQDLIWVLKGLYYSGKEVEQMKDYANKNKEVEEEEEEYLYTIAQVYFLCQKYPPSNRWRKECFDKFSNNKKTITLQDLQGVWAQMNKMKQAFISHESLIEIVKSYGFEEEGCLNFHEFDTLLKERNRFN